MHMKPMGFIATKHEMINLIKNDLILHYKYRLQFQKKKDLI